MDFIKTKGVLIAVTIFTLTLGEVWGVASFAQNVGINTTGNAPNSSALLDINASPGNDKGILIPRLPLTATNVGTPISPAPGAGETGLMVFNTATAGVPPNDVVPGFYYWNGTAWAPLGGGSGGAGGWTDDGTVVRLTTSTDFVGIGTASPAATSALDITSTTKGFLIPRMTTAQRDAITTPATGLQVYNTDCKMLNYWSGTCWISMSKALPSPGAIASAPASTVFCAGQSRTYTIAAVPGASTYTWTVPAGTTINSGQGTTSINATFGNISGNVCVDASNSCETSPVRCISVSVDPIPNTPGNITGITSINPGQQSVTYFVASVNGASTYTWSVPAGATIASGTGTTTIVVNFACNASSGNISVTANSTCGSSPASALALTITPLLSVNAGAGVFGGTTQTIGNAATGGTAAYTYAWLPTANLSASNIATPVAQCTGATTTYTVTATDSRSCTATSTVLVTRNLAASAGAAKFGGTGIGGSPTATGGNATYTYAWSPTSDLSSSTVANPTALCTGVTTTYTVTATDANSCTATSTVVVTRNLTASAGANQTVTCANITIGGAPTATGGNAVYTYSWSPTTALSSATASNPSTTCPAIVTTTYTVTVTDANSCTATSTMIATKSACVVQTFSTAGASSFTPACTGTYRVRVWGGGGGAGAGEWCWCGNYPGAGGGGGGYTERTYTLTGGTAYSLTVGTGGVGGGSGACPGTNGSAGGTSTFNGPIVISSTGGGGGQTGYINVSCCCGTASGGGGGSGSGGTTNTTGVAGAAVNYPVQTGGNGGAGASSGGAGGAGNGSGTGAVGNAPGGGGGGGSSNGGTVGNGGAGAVGRIEVSH